MIEFVTDELLEDYEAFVERHPQGSLFQSCRWGRQKSNWRWRAMVRRNEEGEITGSLALLIRQAPVLGVSLVYGCRGPVCDPDDAETASELLEAAVKEARGRAGYILRLDPAVSGRRSALTEALQQAGFKKRKRRRSYKPAQPKKLWVVPVENQPLAELAKSFSEENRQNVQIARQRGVELRFGGRELVPTLASLLQQESLRTGTVARPEEYLAGLIENFGDKAGIVVAFHENRPVSGALFVTYGSRCACLFTADNGDVTLKARYLVRTGVLQQAAVRGCTECQFSGVPTVRDGPEYAFASGFGGRIATYIGEQDLILRPGADFVSELFGGILRWVRRKIYFFRVR